MWLKTFSFCILASRRPSRHIIFDTINKVYLFITFFKCQKNDNESSSRDCFFTFGVSSGLVFAPLGLLAAETHNCITSLTSDPNSPQMLFEQRNQLGKLIGLSSQVISPPPNAPIRVSISNLQLALTKSKFTELSVKYQEPKATVRELVRRGNTVANALKTLNLDLSLDSFFDKAVRSLYRRHEFDVLPAHSSAFTILNQGGIRCVTNCY